MDADAGRPQVNADYIAQHAKHTLVQDAVGQMMMDYATTVHRGTMRLWRFLLKDYLVVLLCRFPHRRWFRHRGRHRLLHLQPRQSQGQLYAKDARRFVLDILSRSSAASTVKTDQHTIMDAAA